MPTLPTPAQLYTTAKTEVETLAPQLTDWDEGSVNDAMAGAASALADEALRVGVEFFSARLVATAESADLDTVIQDRYPDLVRNPALGTGGSYATTTVTITRSTYVGAHTVTAGTEISGTDSDGNTVIFEADADTTLGGGDASVSVACTAQSPGRSSNVPASTLDTVASLPTGLTVTQPARAAGGNPEEPDDAYRARYRLYRASLVRGTVPALKTGALSVAGVAYVGVREDFDLHDTEVYVADSDGTGNSTMVSNVDAELDNWRAAGVRVTVLASVREVVTETVAVKYRGSLDTAQANTDIKAIVEAFFDALEPGEIRYASLLEAAIHGYSRLIVRADVTTAEVAPTNNYNALRCPASGVTVTFTAVS